jgi:hypothetical protein
MNCANSLAGDEIETLLKPCCRLRIGDYKVIEPPMELDVPIVGGGDQGNAGQPFEKDAEGVSAAHVRVNQIKFLAPDKVAHFFEIVARKSTHFGQGSWSVQILFGEPRIWPANHGDLMSGGNQFVSKESAVDQRSVDFTAGNNLQDLHSVGLRCPH